MHATVTLDHDVLREVERFQREQGMGIGEAVNVLVRRGIGVVEEREPFRQSTSSMSTARIPIDDMGTALVILEGDAHR